MKYKNLTKEQILISLDRLTRFKFTKEKYLRVFFDIILNNLIEPKYKKQDLEKMNVEEIRDMAQNIFNNSVGVSNKYRINEIIKNYENSIYINDNETQILLNNKLDYASAIKYIENDSVVNLKWLKTLESQNNLSDEREKYCLKNPIEKVVLVEGLTEEILLPAFSKFLGFDFYKKGVQIIGAGGKNQVVKMYYKLIEELKLPIFLLLDKDAEENIKQIKPKLRDIDKIHLVSCGEFEDLLPRTLILKTLNKRFMNFSSVSDADFDIEVSAVKNLEQIYKEKGGCDFKKADFAKLVRDNISCDEDISSEIKEIIKELLNPII